jgi:hypothetical protein
MTEAEVSLVHTSGGLLGDVLTDSLRPEVVDGDARILADIATFVSRDGQSTSRAQYDSDLDAAFRTGQAMWTAYATELDAGMDLSRVRERLLIPFLKLLDFDPIYQRAHLPAGDSTWAISHLGWDAPSTPPILLVADEDLDVRGGRRRSPHEELQGYLNNAPVRWGIVSNGQVMRVLRDYHHTRTRGYVEFDLRAIFESGSRSDFLALWRLAHASRFRPLGERTDDGEPITLLEKVYEQALNAGVAAGKRLQPQVRFAIETLANGMLDATPDLRKTLTEDPAKGRDFHREMLTVLYRTLFLLFAEQRGMLSSAAPLYDDTYSLTALRARAEADDAEPRRHDLWEGLKTTFSLFGDERRARALNVYPYNGQLFNLDRTPISQAAKCSNKAVLAAIRALTTVQVGRLQMHVDYRNLGVEELGTVYESLLDYTLTIADKPTPIKDENRVIPAGKAYLASLAIERADLASYYTPSDLVDLLLSRSLDPLIEQRLAAAGSDPQAQVAALLSLKVIDPACGSAAILVGALDRIAYAVAKARAGTLEPLDTDITHARREVLQHCIYGVDKDPFAAELAKVALWIHCIVPDQPLSFLDNHIVCGDALIGWPLLDIPTEIPDDAYTFNKATKDDKKVLGEARKRNASYLGSNLDDEDVLFKAVREVNPDLQPPAILSEDESTFADVRRKANAYRDWTDGAEFAKWKSAADIWTAAFFWTADFGDPPTSREYHDAIEGNADATLAEMAALVVADLDPLHWPLAFPEVREANGFDLVLGNPPWEQYKGEETPFFAQSAPHIAAMTSEHRSTAIAALATSEDDTEVALYDKWVHYKALQDRLSHYAKSSGRFTRTSSEANTYVLFTEAAAGASSHVGLIVKSGIAIDQAQSAVWQSMMDGHRIVEVRDMVNSRRGGGLVFPDVAAVERFCTLVLGPRDPARVIRASMMNFGVDDALMSTARDWPAADISAIAPRTRTLPSTASGREIELALDLQHRFDTLDFSEADGRNPWSLKYATLFHSSGAKKDGLVHRPEDLGREGFVMGADKVFRHPDGRIEVPVYEGQMANRWDHRARTYEGYAGSNKYGRKPHIPWVTAEQHADPSFEVEPRYWMNERVSEKRITEVAGDRVLLAMRDIGRPWTDRRVLRVALIGRAPATHTLPVLSVPVQHAATAAALLNSMTFDFLVRIHMSGGHVTPWIVSQCAAPDPSAMPEELKSIAERLSVTSQRLGDVLDMEVHPWVPETRDLLDARADALVAKAYGLTFAEYETVLDHFVLLKRVEEADEKIGEYRSKRLRLEAFDDLGG